MTRLAALWILGILAVLILLLLLLRVGVHVRFGGELYVTAMAGPVRLQLVPKPEKKEEERPKKEKPPKEKKKKPAEEKQKKLELTPGDIRSALPAVWESLKRGLRKTRQRLRIDPMRLSVCFGGDDPAQAAEAYGWANTAMWTVMPEMERLTRMPDPHIHLETDFTASETHISGEVGLSFRVGDLLAIGFAFAGPALRWYKAFRKEKSEQEKKAAQEKKTPENTENRAPTSAEATHTMN